MTKHFFRYFLGAIFAFAGLVISTYAYAQIQEMPVQLHRISQFSGKIVPRFESLRASKVNGRVGPSMDHPIRWQYKSTGLPVMVVRETLNWSKVRDPSGAEVWVFNKLLSSRPTAICQHETILRKKPSDSGKGLVRLAQKVVLTVQSCNAKWCQVRTGKHKGWVARKDIWGATKIEPEA